ncbi:protocadherin gamma-C3-like [Columba livia]|uniref:Protocadherin gamma-C3-like n=1 Tax=Columba livia TaxID=8932 RepID=A0A2I0LQN6_COLLI|nr:protocadherin gamma-C3-like [Columba livia]
MCGEAVSCSVSFEALVQNPLNVFDVEVAIQDINDNSPRFLKENMQFEIIESTIPGARFYLGMAEDADVGSNSLQGYELEANGYFAVEVKESPDGSKFAELVLRRALDREREASLRLVLTALDGGDPPRSGTAQLCINVTDANDNTPVFAQDRYRASLREDAPPGSTVLNVSASDADAGTNARITYSFGETPAKVLQKFAVDPEGGMITLQEALDFEDTRSFSLAVEARDGGGLVAHCKVEVDVLDVNDNAPEVTLTSVSSPVPEDAPAGTVVALLKMRDRDSGENGEVSCELSGEAPLSLVKSSGGSYKVVTASALDREQAAEHRVTVVARDRGRPSLSSSTALVLEVSDVNDNAPVFEEAAYSAYVAENNAAGAPILRVLALDPDAGANGRVSYWLSGGSADAAAYVSVEARSGALYAQRSFDYEQCREFAVVVRAQDGGEPARSSTATVRVFVLDRNDNAPRVLWPAPEAGERVPGSAPALEPFEVVPRSAEAGYLVAKVDAGQNAWLSYELVQAAEPALFRVGLHSGEVRTARAVSERDAAKQRLVVVVKDHGQPALSATATLHVVLAESLQEALPELSERAAGADSLTSDLNLILVVALAVVSLVFVLTVILIFFKCRRSRSPPIFITSDKELYSSLGSKVPYNYCSSTLPLPYSYEVCLASDSGQKDFTFLRPGTTALSDCLLDGEHGSGTHSRKDPPIPESLAQPGRGGAKRGARPSCAMNGVAVRSRGVTTGQVLSLLLLFGVSDWVSAAIRYAIPEEARRGSAVGNVVADLALDLGRLPGRRLRVVSGGNKKYFGVDLTSGALLVSERIDREELCGALSPCSLSFEIVVENPLELFSGAVEIQDINDNDPVFPSSQARLEISESVAAGARFPLESAQDPDVGINSLQTYQLSANPHFALDVQTRVDGSKYAELVLEKELDREEQRELHLVLTALDGGSPPRSAHVQIHIEVVDANDNAPVFNQSTYKASVRENTPSGTLVARISAYDLDDGPNGDIVYSFSSHTPAKVRELFALDSATGELRVKGQLDYEETKLYEIYLQAKDKGAVPGVAHCKVLVEVVDVNDNSPEVTVTSVYSPVPEDAAPGTVVALLSVTDLDSHDNGVVNCFISPGIPFMLSSSLKNYYTLKTKAALDREKASEYNITITARDSGSPPLSAVKQILVQVSDVNDNAPKTSQDSYDVYVLENNVPGIPILNISATDPDLGRNAHLSYSLLQAGHIFSINRENGTLYLLTSLDHEDQVEFSMMVQVQDGGSPPLATNVSVSVFVTDLNDNAPTVLYPQPNTTATYTDVVAPGTPAGHMVTKVVAVDADAGYNAWISYTLLQATDPSLFSVGLHSGEIFTARQLQEDDVPQLCCPPVPLSPSLWLSWPRRCSLTSLTWHPPTIQGSM